MDVLESSPAPLRLPVVIGAALALLAVGQLGALVRTPGLPDDVGLEAEPFGYGFLTEGDQATVFFNLTNRGERRLRVLAVGRDGPGLELVDVVASGAPLGFRAGGEGDEPMPRFTLPPGETIVLRLVHRVGCADVTDAAFPVPLRLQQGRAKDVVTVALPRLPDDAEDAGPDDEVEWQTAMVKELCSPQ